MPMDMVLQRYFLNKRILSSMPAAIYNIFFADYRHSTGTLYALYRLFVFSFLLSCFGYAFSMLLSGFDWLKTWVKGDTKENQRRAGIMIEPLSLPGTIRTFTF